MEELKVLSKVKTTVNGITLQLDQLLMFNLEEEMTGDGQEAAQLEE